MFAGKHNMYVCVHLSISIIQLPIIFLFIIYLPTYPSICYLSKNISSTFVSVEMDLKMAYTLVEGSKSELYEAGYQREKPGRISVLLL